MNTPLKARELSEFAAAIAKSIECLYVEHPNDSRLLDWVRELLSDAQVIAGVGNRDLLRSEVWQRLQLRTQQRLYALCADRPYLQSGSPIDVQPRSRSKRREAAGGGVIDGITCTNSLVDR